MSEILAIFGGVLLLFAAVLVYLLYRAILYTRAAEEHKREERAQAYTDLKQRVLARPIFPTTSQDLSRELGVGDNKYYQSARRLDRMSSKKPIIVSTQKPNPSATDCKTFTVLKSR